MRVLVTGGLGYIGSVAVHMLVRNGYEVSVLDDLSTGYREAVKDEVAVVEGSLLDGAAVRRALEGVDVVLHFAAKSLVSEGEKFPELYERVNVEGSKVLFDAMEEVGVRRIVISSTAAVYGDPGVALIDELVEPNPSNQYGRSKLKVERDAASRDFSTIALRYFNVAGAAWTGSEWLSEKHTPETHLIPNLVGASKDAPVTVFGTDWPTPDGSAVRDYVHVVDLIDAHILAVRQLDKTGFRVVNLGGGRGYSVLEVIECAREVLGREVPTVFAGRREGDPSTLVADIERAAEMLGWRPKLGLADMIRDYAKAL